MNELERFLDEMVQTVSVNYDEMLSSHHSEFISLAQAHGFVTVDRDEAGNRVIAITPGGEKFHRDFLCNQSWSWVRFGGPFAL